MPAELGCGWQIAKLEMHHWREGPSPPHATLELSLHHHCPCKRLASWLREITKKTLTKHSHSDVFCACWALRRSLPWSCGKCQLLHVSWGSNSPHRRGLWRWDFSLSNSEQLFNMFSYTTKLCSNHLLSKSSSLLSYYHWFSQWYPFAFSLLNAHNICFLSIYWTGNYLSDLNLSDLWVGPCSMLLLLIKNLWLLCYKYVSWIQGFIIPIDTEQIQKRLISGCSLWCF